MTGEPVFNLVDHAHPAAAEAPDHVELAQQHLADQRVVFVGVLFHRSGSPREGTERDQRRRPEPSASRLTAVAV